MNLVSRFLSGGGMFLGGLVLISIPLFSEENLFFLWIYGIPLVIFGIFIIFNSKEDSIEKINYVKGGKK
jgi:hypothetical protein